MQTCNHQNLKSEEGRDRKQDRKWGQKQGHGGPCCHQGFNSANHQELLKGLPGELKFQIDPSVGSMKSGRSRKKRNSCNDPNERGHICSRNAEHAPCVIHLSFSDKIFIECLLCAMPSRYREVKTNTMFIFVKFTIQQREKLLSK